MAQQVEPSLWAMDPWQAYLQFLAIALVFITVTAALFWMERGRSRKIPKYHRRMSHLSAIGANRQFLEEAVGMKQNVINAILFFDEVPARDDFVCMMMTLANKYERMGALPRFEGVGARGSRECVWCRLADLGESIDKAVILDSEYGKEGDDDVHILQRAHAHIGTLLTTQDEEGQLLPLWRVVVLSPTAALIRIDHCICDGLSAVTLLKDIGIKTSSNMPLTLSDLSPILRAIEKAGDLRIASSPLKLLWPFNLVRAIRCIAQSMSFGKEVSNPLRPLPEDIGSPIPSQNCGTVYFPTMPVPLFKDISRAMGNGTTINDILLLCLSVAFGRYMDALEGQGQQYRDDINNVKILLPIGNPLCPSQYGDYHDGLCNRMTPVIVPLAIPRRSDDGTTASPSPMHAIEEIRSYMERIKRSHAPLLMTCLNTILTRLIPLDKMKEAGKRSFEGVSCVYSNVPGPVESVSLKPSSSKGEPKEALSSATTRRCQYKIAKIQTVLPHPVSIFQILSYDSSMYFNITLDTRAATSPWILRSTFIDAVNCVADVAGVKSKWEDELSSFKTSEEWGGSGMVYHCG